MKFLFFVFFLIFLFSCGKQNENIGYRIEQLNNNDGSYYLKLLDKNNSPVVIFHFGNDGPMNRVVMDNDRNFRLIVNLDGDKILSYLISDGNYTNTTNVFNDLNGRDDGVILNRAEQINENIVLFKDIDIYGLYINYSFYSFGTRLYGRLGPIREKQNE
jgi:hypothetical protein